MWSSKRRQADLLATLDLPYVIDIRELTDEVSRRTGKEVILEPQEQAPALCGACVVTGTRIYVLYDPRTSRLHQDHIIAHEFGHLLLGHHQAQPASVLAADLATGIDPAVVRMMLGRTTYDQAEERESEMLASLLQRRIIARGVLAGTTAGDDVQERVAHTLLRREGWRA